MPLQVKGQGPAMGSLSQLHRWAQPRWPDASEQQDRGGLTVYFGISKFDFDCGSIMGELHRQGTAMTSQTTFHCWREPACHILTAWSHDLTKLADCAG